MPLALNVIRNKKVCVLQKKVLSFWLNCTVEVRPNSSAKPNIWSVTSFKPLAKMHQMHEKCLVSASKMKYNLGQTDDIGLESPRSMSTASKVNKQITNKPIAPFMSAFFRKTIYNPLHSVIECQLKITTQEGK